MSLITVEISEDAYDVVLAVLMGLAWTVANVVGGCMVFGLYAMAMRRPSAAPKGFLPKEPSDDGSTAPRTREIFRHKKLPADVDYVVVGSGVSGLYLAALLSRCGYVVVVLEQHYAASSNRSVFSREFRLKM